METPNPILELEKTTERLNAFMDHRRRTVFGRYPFTFSFLATFGAVCIFYGIHAILDQIPLMHEQPLVPVAIGIVILLATGSLYKRLEEKKVD